MNRKTLQDQELSRIAGGTGVNLFADTCPTAASGPAKPKIPRQFL